MDNAKNGPDKISKKTHSEERGFISVRAGLATYFTAMVSISTSAPIGRFATS